MKYEEFSAIRKKLSCRLFNQQQIRRESQSFIVDLHDFKHTTINEKVKEMGTTDEIIMLGTGNATVTRCYNTCFVLKDKDNSLLLVDGGGGNGVLSQLEKANIALTDIHDVFLTHAHTDHILGIVWVARMIMQKQNNGTYQGVCRIHSHERALHVLEEICRMTLPQKVLTQLGKGVVLCEVKDKEEFFVRHTRVQCFDIHSAKEKQFGFRATLPDGKTVVCLGDEPYNEHNRALAQDADWMMCEAFCLYRDREIFKPYEKHHSTALEAGKLANELNIKDLILYHTEDTQLEERKALYTAEAKQHFKGRVVVPDDLETIVL